MSEFKTDKIRPVDAGGTTTIGCTGDTIATGSGTTLNIQGTYSGINAISWDTTAKTANFTAETNKGYFINTTSGGVTITLPATPVAGSFIGIKDYALTAQTNNITINPNGNKIQGTTDTYVINTQGGSANLVYVDSTQGWLTFDAAQASDISENATFIVATGGTITTCGNDKIHTFTSPGTFCVTSVGNPAGGGDTVNYMVVAGGGAGGFSFGSIPGGQSPTSQTRGGGGAGGYRASGYGPAPLQAPSLTVTATGFPITVGAGGSAGASGANSVFSTITSAGGGVGAYAPGGSPAGTATSGGSGGGGSTPTYAAGSGNTPPVSPPQGNNGGSAPGPTQAAGGGGATAVGGNGPNGVGGAGAPNAISGSATTYAGGGGGGQGAGGAGGGGTGGNQPGGQGSAGTANTGGGGGGGTAHGTNGSAAGGSGIVIIRYRYQ
jgi:hypothetical protein